MTDPDRLNQLKEQAITELRAATSVLEEPEGETIVALRCATRASRMIDDAVTEENRG